MKKIAWLFWILVFAVLVLFAATLALENKDWIEISYYFFAPIKVPLFALLVVPFFIGLLVGMLIMSLSVFKHKRQCSIEKRKLVKVEREVENLRALPLKDEV